MVDDITAYLVIAIEIFIFALRARTDEFMAVVFKLVVSLKLPVDEEWFFEDVLGGRVEVKFDVELYEE